MDPEAELAELIQLGHDIASLKLYAVGATALMAYDYLLTLKDEVRYAWRTENVLMFILFLFSRYLPPAFQTWILITATSPYPGYVTSEVCNKIAFIQVLYYTVIMAFAQIVLTQRAYAITRKNKWIAGILYTISGVQFIVGFYMTIRAAGKPAAILPTSLYSYRLCIANVQETLTIIQLFLSLAFDIAVFALAIVQNQITKWVNRGVDRTSILDTISRDARKYFGLITMSHFLIVVMYVAARPGIGRLPVVGTAVFIPMICRTIMSLKEVASSQRPRMSIELQTGPLSINSRDFHTFHTVGGVRLSVLRSWEVQYPDGTPKDGNQVPVSH